MSTRRKPKCPECSGGWCKNHIFELEPFKNSFCYYRKKMKLRLCPKHNSATNKFIKILPIINEDRKHYTPCFLLEDEKTYYRDNDEKLLSTHNLKLQSEGTCTIMVPKHGRKKNYCSVCKVQYEDYLEHTDDPTHRYNLRNNKFSKFILDVQKQMQQGHAKQEPVIDPPIEPLSKMVDQTKDIQKLKENSELAGAIGKSEL